MQDDSNHIHRVIRRLPCVLASHVTSLQNNFNKVKLCVPQKGLITFSSLLFSLLVNRRKFISEFERLSLARLVNELQIDVEVTRPLSTTCEKQQNDDFRQTTTFETKIIYTFFSAYSRGLLTIIVAAAVHLTRD